MDASGRTDSGLITQQLSVNDSPAPTGDSIAQRFQHSHCATRRIARAMGAVRTATMRACVGRTCLGYEDRARACQCAAAPARADAQQQPDSLLAPLLGAAGAFAVAAYHVARSCAARAPPERSACPRTRATVA